jgi:F0F1-type ATP synthase delta subunit
MVIWQAILIVVAIYSVLIFLFYKFVYAASIEQVKQLKKLVEEGDRKLREVTEEKEKANSEIQRLFAEAEKEVSQIRIQARKDGERTEEETRERARQESERIIQQALSVKDHLYKEIEKKAQERCLAMTDQVLHEVLSASDLEKMHECLVRQTVEELQGLKDSKLEHLAASGILETPYALSQETAQRISSILSKKSGRDIFLKQETEKMLIAGIRIQIGSFSIDGSLSQRIQDAVQQRTLENP